MKRVDYIDCVKGIAIFFMVLCHTGMHNSFTQWIYAFHMPLFFIVSGMLYKNTVAVKVLVMKKVKQLLIPYLLFALILCFGENSYFDWIGIFYASRNSLWDVNTFTPLWFLPCFFVSTVIFAAINKFKVRVRFLVVIFLGALGYLLSELEIGKWRYPLNMDVAFVGVLLMYIGSVFNKYITNCRSVCFGVGGNVGFCVGIL